jgi:signal transduction histidine kinase
MVSGRRPEAIDTRMVFRAYAVLACLYGLALIVWPNWFVGPPAGPPAQQAALIRLLGSILIAVAFCAAALAAVDDPRTRRAGLLWFAAGHYVVFIALGSQLSDLELAGTEQLMYQLLCVACALMYLGQTAEGEYTYGDGGFFGPAGKRLRSQYEQQIRQAAAQEERNRLARDLHDSIKQQLFVIQTAAATVQARSDADPAGATQALQQVRNSAREAMTEMEAMTDQLRSGPLTNAGLIEALKRHCEALGFRTGARVEFSLEGDLPDSEALPPSAQQAILRVAEEALANVGRHARARNVRLSLYSPPGRVEIRIGDDGSGFDTNQSPRGMGIANMRARAAELGGKLELMSRPGQGTSVKFSIPYTTAETPREYLRRALLAGALLLGFVVYVVWLKLFLMIILAGPFAIQFIRNVVAYRRVRKQPKVGP